jgi:small subunit ribosomal protein S1
MSNLSTAAASGESFADLFAESLKNHDMKSGEVISAEVLRIDHNFVVVNAGLKSEALIPLEEFLNDQGEVEVNEGDFISVAIDSLENGYGDTILSRDRAKRLSAWLQLETALESGDLARSGLATLRAYVEALGGSVEVTATFGNRRLVLSQREVSTAIRP